ncbi:MAG: methyltransferase domain-containing protein [Polyangiaceae bacterium]|nr:methyltransferase domain-containing protein [Polyangiaceae bacterium]
MQPLIARELEDYVFAHTKAPQSLFEELREVTYESMQNPAMQVGRVEGALLRNLVAMSGAKRILEIGTFTGYSALSMAEALPADGRLTTCDIDPQAVAVAQRFFNKSPHGAKITIRLGDALEYVKSLTDADVLDLVFLDADKARYVDYYEAVLPRLKQGGLVVADNTLWSGRVLDPKSDDDKGITRFNDRVVNDPRVDNVLLAVRDGVMLARKL